MCLIMVKHFVGNLPRFYSFTVRFILIKYTTKKLGVIMDLEFEPVLPYLDGPRPIIFGSNGSKKRIWILKGSKDESTA